MKIIRGFKAQGFIVAATFIAGLGLGTRVFAQVEHAYLIDLNKKTATDLGTLGGSSSTAFGINDAGQVVGYFDRAHAFITGPNGAGMRDLGTVGERFFSAAFGINATAQVAGYTAGCCYQAFITGPNGMEMRDLGTLGATPYPYTQSWATGINDAGQVVGYSNIAVDHFYDHAFITGSNGMEMRDLGTLGATRYDVSRATGINSAGQVVGESTTAAGPTHAFITGPNGTGMTDLGTLGGGTSQALAINDAGQVVGVATTTAGDQHAFITGPNGVGMTDLGTLGGGFSQANGINDAGQVVGQSNGHAFITGPNGVGMTDLNALMSGVVLTDALGINNHGQVTANGVSAIPEPETYALLLAGLGLIGFVARRRKTA